MKLQLADDLNLPVDAVTQTFLIVGKRGSGKSNTAARLVEQFHRAKLPFVVLDPVDTWWGLKAGRAGEKGLDVYVFGGRKQDLPLNAGDGALIADVLCEHRASMVLSVKHLSGRERSTFMVAFAQTLFQKWGGGPLHVVLEEAHELAPQNTQNAKEGEQQMLGAFKRLWKLGRSSGIGGSAITQRPASLSKDITTQSEILIAHRTIGPQDVDAIGQWVKYHGERLDILAELPTLPTGEAFVWAPEFPEGKAIGLVRTAILLRETYDSASTPKVGEQRVEPKELAPVDLERLRAKMSATIEKAKADDPRELRKQIKDLRAELAVKVVGRALCETPAKVVEKHVLKDGQLARAEKIAAHIEKLHDGFRAQLEALVYAGKEIEAAITSTRRQPPIAGVEYGGHYTPQRDNPTTNAPVHRPQGRRVAPGAATTRPAPLVSASSNGNGHVKLGTGERKVLTALAQYPDGRTKRQLGILAVYSIKGGRFNNILGALRSAGYATGGDTLRITPEGVTALGDWTALPHGAELLAYWRGQLQPSEAKVLSAIAEAYPQPLAKDDVAASTDPPYEPTGGRFNNILGKLRSLELITGKGELTASAELFD